MNFRRALVSKYFVPRLALLAAVLFFGTFIEARAQIDQNLQSRFSTFSPPINVLPLDIANESATKEKAAKKPDTCKVIDDPRGLFTDLQRAEKVAKLYNEVMRAKKQVLPGSEEKPVPKEYFIKEGIADNEKISQFFQQSDVIQFINANKRKDLYTLQILPTAFKCGRAQPQGLKISFPFNPTYESNVLRV
jgi:hypothetical protein